VFGLIAPVLSARAQSPTITETQTYTFFAGQNIPAGTITIANDDPTLPDAKIYVTYTMAPGWQLTQAHVAYGDDLDDLPQNTAAMPSPVNFPWAGVSLRGVTTVTYAISFSAFNTLPYLVIAAHGVVQQVDSNGRVLQQQSAWGNGLPFPGKNWDTYMNYTILSAQGNR